MSFDESKWAICMQHPDFWDSTGVALKHASDAEKRRALTYYLEEKCATVLLKTWSMLRDDDPITA